MGIRDDFVLFKCFKSGFSLIVHVAGFAVRIRDVMWLRFI